ncbi:gluconate 2-dehydrogenase subunit 3 family protein [Halohasta litorea]|uniref:Gluconate 2-dehydrogenase subunit 3 family protein n=1 Tax=Halohasta litorea TaxID=869891 RepID=A0ABD6D3G7_9EURY|nr:gluconate 2-dehydrogenase subunit 3 family protein [Halohasta litorea]
MELTRRDAVAALGALGAGTAGAGCLQEDASDESVQEALVATAEVLYPSAVEGIDEFVETFLAGRLDEGPHAEGVRAAVDALETRAESWYGDRFAGLAVGDRDSVLQEAGVAAAEEDPDGTPAERIRYYVVNELLLALYSSPTGGELVGIENPQGHAGGLDSYQRGPEA